MVPPTPICGLISTPLALSSELPPLPRPSALLLRPAPKFPNAASSSEALGLLELESRESLRSGDEKGGESSGGLPFVGEVEEGESRKLFMEEDRWEECLRTRTFLGLVGDISRGGERERTATREAEGEGDLREGKGRRRSCRGWEARRRGEVR
jgi:hypothetical protein